MNYIINIDFSYETTLAGTKLSGRMECNDYEDITSIVQVVLDWCEDHGFKMIRIDINRLDKED